MDDALRRKAVILGGAAFAAALATIVGAWGFELIGGYEPCALCLRQRVPYYIGVPVLALGVLVALASWRRPPWASRIIADADRAMPVLAAGVLLAGAGIFAWSAYLGIQHAGVEWGFWNSPISCGAGSVPVTNTGVSLIDRIATAEPVVDCGVAQWRLAGLSFAGWNGVISVVVAVVALNASLAAWRSRSTLVEAPAE